MKRPLKGKQIILCAAALCAAFLAGPNARGNSIPITGSIGFGATGVTINSPNLVTATDFNVASPYTTVETGTYAAVPEATIVAFNGFVFNPPVASITPLWTFKIGSTVYSFDATSDSSSFNSKLDQWDIGGAGMAMVTGYTDTPGTWNVNLSQSGASFVFDSSAAPSNPASAPDGGSTLWALGGLLPWNPSVLGRKVRR